MWGKSCASPKRRRPTAKGDNLWNLSRKFGTTVSTLAKDNYIPNPSLIYIGDVLRIPKK